VVAIVVPEEEYLKNYCKKNGIEGSFKELCNNKVSLLLKFMFNTLIEQEIFLLELIRMFKR
jgi:hypothetical protein